MCDWFDVFSKLGWVFVVVVVVAMTVPPHIVVEGVLLCIPCFPRLTRRFHATFFEAASAPLNDRGIFCFFFVFVFFRQASAMPLFPPAFAEARYALLFMCFFVPSIGGACTFLFVSGGGVFARGTAADATFLCRHADVPTDASSSCSPLFFPMEVSPPRPAVVRFCFRGVLFFLSVTMSEGFFVFLRRIFVFFRRISPPPPSPPVVLEGGGKDGFSLSPCPELVTFVGVCFVVVTHTLFKNFCFLPRPPRCYRPSSSH